ncbi:MAG: hypothetical protein QXT77_00110 [Candidatus Methanomethylicaceae archaeon]
MSWLWFLLPDEALPLLIIGIGLALMIGLMRLRAALSLIGLFLFFSLLSPFVEALLVELPAWILLLILAWVGLAILRGLATLFLGRGAADEMVGTLAAHLVIVILLLPVRILRWVFRLLTHSNG